MNGNYNINLDHIMQSTDGGRLIIEDIHPESKEGFTKKRNFSIRPDDKHPSCSVFRDKKNNSVWLLQDKGGADTAAKTAIALIQERKNCSFYEALVYAAEKYCNGNGGEKKNISYPEPIITPSPEKYEAITPGPERDLTDSELTIIGKDVKQEHCTAFNLRALDYYFTKANDKGISYKIQATEKYPILLYRYKDFGKLYQPFSNEYRFIYIGSKPTDHLFADVKTAKLLNRAMNDEPLFDSSPDNDDEAPTDPRLDQVIICSGPSDAINVYAQGYSVTWLNSETAKFSSYEYVLLKKIAKRICWLADIDSTGIRQALKVAVKFLDIALVWLPSDLKNFKDWKGKPCKDVRDLFKHYHNPKNPNNVYYFKQLVRTALPLRFWNEIQEFDKNGKRKPEIKYEINNEQCYRFLSAHGFYTLTSMLSKSKREFSFIHIDEATKIVRAIPDENLCKYVNDFLASFVRNNLEYNTIALLNAIHRSRQLTLSSLANLERIEIDFKAHSKDHDHVFFKNCVVKISGQGIEPIQYINNTQSVWDFKIVDHAFTKREPLFNIDFSEKYNSLKKQIGSCTDQDEVSRLRTELDSMPVVDKFTLKINSDFSFLKYLYNTGRVFWRKEEDLGPAALTEYEKKIQDLHFISKIIGMGYALCKYKNPGMAYALYAMETEQSDVGQHKGGTGKSIYFSAIEKIINVAFIDGQRNDFKDDKHLFSSVIKDVTDFIYFDDLNQYTDLHLFMPAVTGKMTVKSLFKDKYMIDYPDSPKMGISSNHAVRNIDQSIRRRLWFLGFSNYYHPGNKSKQLHERTPLTEFGHNLINDYGPEAMNTFYNFMLQCLQTFLKFNMKVEPDLADIDKRNMQNLMGDDFLNWAESYFTDDRLNINVEKQQAYQSWLDYLPDTDKKKVSAQKFKKQLMSYAEYMDYIFNPDDLLKSPSEKQRNQIKGYKDGNQVEFFHFRTSQTDTEIEKNDDTPF